MPNATSTWKSQDFPTKQTAGEFVSSNADKPGSFSALLPVFFVIPKAVKVEFLSLFIFEKNSVSVGLAPGHPPSM